MTLNDVLLYRHRCDVSHKKTAASRASASGSWFNAENKKACPRPLFCYTGLSLLGEEFPQVVQVISESLKDISESLKDILESLKGIAEGIEETDWFNAVECQSTLNEQP